MHIILGVLASVVTILYYMSLLSKSRIDLGWLNPFTWHRRKKWRAHMTADPLYSIKSPMEATACLMYAAAKSSGDVSREQKERMLELFRSEFNLSSREATELLSSCSFLMKHDEDKIINSLGKFLAPSAAQFNTEQKNSAFEMCETVAHCEGAISEKQIEFLSALKEAMFNPAQGDKKWA